MNQKKAHNSNWKEQRRWRALELKRDGWTHEEVAEVLGVTKGAVSQWMKRVADEGEHSLSARPHKGATPKLTAEQKQLLPDFLSHGTEPYGFRGEFWNSLRVRELIRREFNVTYHKNHIPRLLRELGWTPQKPLERATQRDETRIAQWREEVWPILKKKPSGSSEPPSLLMNRHFTCCRESFTLGLHEVRLRS
jgi:putative transposase